MTTKIEQKIVGYRVKSEPDPMPPEMTETTVQMSEQVKRPRILRGTTYKISTPQTPHALYLTVNDIVLNAGTGKESRHPYEIFLNSKNMDSFQWITALTLVVSAVFRKGGNITFMVDELKSVFDPRGGYFKKQSYMPSVIAEIGHTLEEHLVSIGLIDASAQAEQRSMAQAILAEKEFEIRDKATEIEFPESAVLCQKCLTKAMVLMDGCMTCLNCGESKCG